MSRVVLGVPTLNRYDLCAALILSACAAKRPPDLILIVDNGGKLDVCDWPMFSVRIDIHDPGKNLGVGSSWNFLAQRFLLRPSDKLMVCGDDVTLHSDTLAVLEDTMDSTGADFAFPDPSRSSMHQTFSCFMARKNLFDKTGYFDEKFWPAYFEDNDFHRRMKLAGISEAVAPCGYDHVNSGTMKKFTDRELEAHHVRFRSCREYYLRKWGGLPGHEAFAEPFNGGASDATSTDL